MARILINHVTPFPDKITGITVYCWKMLEALARLGGHSYVLATPWTPEACPPVFAELGVTIVRNPAPRNQIAALLSASRSTSRIARTHGCDIILSTQPTATLAGGAARAMVLHDLYMITHPHLYPARSRAQWTLMTRLAIARSHAVVAVSDTTRRAAAAAYPFAQARMSTIHEASPLSAPDTPAGDPPIAGPFILCVANVTPNKNLETVVAALRRLDAAGRAFTFCLIGRDEPGVLAGASLRNIAVVNKAGVADAELIRHYRHATLFVNASTVEGFCLPVLEAQTLGCPVICSDIDILREVGGDGAAFFPPLDPAALAGLIDRGLEDSAWRSDLAARGRANATRFSWEKAAREFSALFDRLARPAPPHGDAA